MLRLLYAIKKLHYNHVLFALHTCIVDKFKSLVRRGTSKDKLNLGVVTSGKNKWQIIATANPGA